MLAELRHRELNPGFNGQTLKGSKSIPGKVWMANSSKYLG